MKYHVKKFGKLEYNSITVLCTNELDAFFSRKVEQYKRIGFFKENQISFII